MSRALVQIDNFSIRRITLPQQVQHSIDEKLAEEQSVQEYTYILQREHLESERKAVEAEGVRRFQEVVSSNISDAYLRWRGIDATLRLAESPNSKVVVIGNGPGSMPLILGDLGGTGSTTGTPAARPPSLSTGVSRPSSATAAASSAAKPSQKPAAAPSAGANVP
jgi:regulator of protease activity HflC (stomatin/prohibitin superfamily)